LQRSIAGTNENFCPHKFRFCDWMIRAILLRKYGTHCSTVVSPFNVVKDIRTQKEHIHWEDRVLSYRMGTNFILL